MKINSLASTFRFSLVAAALFVTTRAWAADPTNAALKKTATASGSEDAHPPEDAVDGDDTTRWCSADGEVGAWWQVDLGAAKALGGCQITWEHDGAVYLYVIEGSADGKTWKTLNDQQASQLSAATQKLLLTGDPARYVRIRVTGLDDGSWASFSECKIFEATEMKKLTPAELKAYQPSAEALENIALKKTATASSAQPGHAADAANDADIQTRWSSQGGATRQWWMVDLAGPPASAPATAPATPATRLVSGVDIRWEQDRGHHFLVEGSTDGTTWVMLSDQSGNSESRQAEKLRFPAKEVRYVRITETNLQPPATASILDVQVLSPKK